MSDQCMNCTVRGDLKVCLSTDCSQHESWMTQEVMKQLKASQDEVSRLRKPICPQCETELEPCVQENYLYSESLDWFCECEVDDLSEIRSKLNQASETKGEG